MLIRQNNRGQRKDEAIYFFVLMMTFMLAACAPESGQILVYLPTATSTATASPTTTHTPTPTITSTLTPTRDAVREGPTSTATATPQPWLEIELSIHDAETGEAVAGDVYVGLRVDDKELGYPIEENVSVIIFELPREVTRADAVYINVIAEGYYDRLLRLPADAKYREKLTLDAPLKRATN